MKSDFFRTVSLLVLLAGTAHAQPPAAAVPATATPPAAPAMVAQAAPAAAAPARNPASDMALSALVTADNEATLSAQMAGRVKKIHYGIGHAFPAGAVLAEFDCAEAQAKLDALNAEYLGARETHLAKLKLQGLGAAGDLEVTLAAAAGEKAKSQVRQQEAQLAYCRVRAPYAGRIVRLKAKEAENVAPNQPIMEIVANTRLKATVHVPAALALQLKPGSPAAIEIKDTGRRYEARVSRLNARIDSVSQSLEVEVAFSGKTPGLLPGMIGQAVFPQKADGGGKPN